MLVRENKLREIIRNIITESLNLKDSNSINNTIEKLNRESKTLKDELSSQNDIESFDHYISDRLDNVIGSFDSDFEYLGDGAFRRVYALPGQGWVLKLAQHIEGAKVNRQEIQISGINKNDDLYHGLGARNIFTKVYDYDRDNDLPWWIISQRVIPLYDIYDLELLKVIFPTFWNILNSVTNNKNDFYLDKAYQKKTRSGSFIRFITDMLIGSVIKSRKVKKPSKDDIGWKFLNKKQKPPYYSIKSYRGLTKEMIYNEASNMFGGELLPIEEISFGRDVEILSRGLAYVGTTDLDDGNIGIVSSTHPSPDDIVILDFDMHS